MKTIFDHIEHIKGKPHHIRKKVAFGVAGAATAIVALVWLVSSLSTNAFAIAGSSFAESTGQAPVITTTESAPVGGSQNIAGAGAALNQQDESAPAHIEIVNTVSSSTKPDTPVEKTRIPF